MTPNGSRMALKALRILGAEHLAGDDPVTALALVAIGIAQERDRLRDRERELVAFVNAEAERLGILSQLLTRIVNKETAHA